MTVLPLLGGRRKWTMLASLAITIIAALGIAASRTSPPGLLSLLDGAMGGGWGVEKLGEGIAFGTHGQRLDVWRPTQRGREPMPVLIFWYGGGWVKGSRDAYAFAAR